MTEEQNAEKKIVITFCGNSANISVVDINTEDMAMACAVIASHVRIMVEPESFKEFMNMANEYLATVSDLSTDELIKIIGFEEEIKK